MDKRFWCSVWGFDFYCGWEFGDTPEEARDKVIKSAQEWKPAALKNKTGRNSVLITLQRDTSPAEYFSFEVEGEK